MCPAVPRSPLFPYTTLFRSLGLQIGKAFIGRYEDVDIRMLLAKAGQARQEPARGEGGQGAHAQRAFLLMPGEAAGDRKSTRLNSSHVAISYAVFCLKKKKQY